MIIVATTAQVAREYGMKYFFNVKPCLKGHVGWRSAESHSCKECLRERNRKRRATPGYVEKVYWKETPEKREKQRQASLLWKERNRHKILEQSRRTAAKGITEEKRKERNIKRNHLKKQTKLATPKWLTAFDRKRIDIIYHVRDLLIERTGEIYHVDHIVPLRGKDVCGLHVPGNLRVIPKSENLRKYKKWDAENNQFNFDRRSSVIEKSSDLSFDHGAQRSG